MACSERPPPDEDPAPGGTPKARWPVVALATVATAAFVLAPVLSLGAATFTATGGYTRPS